MTTPEQEDRRRKYELRTDDDLRRVAKQAGDPGLVAAEILREREQSKRAQAQREVELAELRDERENQILHTAKEANRIARDANTIARSAADRSRNANWIAAAAVLISIASVLTSLWCDSTKAPSKETNADTTLQRQDGERQE
jgi:predicted nucleic acid-binding protein